MDYKNIHIGNMLKNRVTESGIDMSRICNFLKVEEDQVLEMYQSEDISTGYLLRWSKLLKYDFFRLYSQHLILYAPQGNMNYHKTKNSSKTSLPEFRKNIYTCEVIDFILEMISTGKKTRSQVIDQYGIPKTTLYKWISKNSKF